MYKGNNVFIQKLLIFINMIILPVLIVLAWHFATSTGAMSTLGSYQRSAPCLKP